MNKNFYILILSFALCISHLNLFSQATKQHTVSGQISDSITGEPLPGVTIKIEGTYTGTVTGMDGKYSMQIPGNVVLEFSYISYTTKKVMITDERNVDVVLSSASINLSGVQITAQAIGQNNAILLQINSNTVKNVVAADRLRANPDANSAEAIGRLPGISLLRSGGEGVGLVIRGLEPRYSSVTLNGVQLPSTSGNDRGTNLNGISQYALQGAEVFKSLTADMDANSVAGTVNLKIRAAPKDIHTNVMVQKGYNSLNDYWGNYKLLGEFSNRFFKDKLGVLLTANSESVNRSTQFMSAAYGIDGGNPEGDILVNAINLNNISSIIHRNSAMLSLDYKVTQNTTLMLYGMYSASKNDRASQGKGYGVGGSGSVGYGVSVSPDNKNSMVQTALSGESKFKFLNISADYGISYSKGNNANVGNRNWNFAFNNVSSSAITDIEHRKMDPRDLVPLFTDDPSNLKNCWLTGIGMSNSTIEDKNLTAHLNLSVPFKIGNMITGNVKFGGMARQKKRFRDDQVGDVSFNAGVNPISKHLADSLDWIVLDGSKNITALGLEGEPVNNFLNGDYNFGSSFNLDRLNQVYDKWMGITQYYWDMGPDKALPIIFDYRNITFSQNVNASALNDQDMKETYGAAYIMPEFNFGKYVMFMPGLRFEKTHNDMNGYYSMPIQLPPNIFEAVPGQDTSAVRSDEFFLPMIHLRIKPTEKFYAHFSYTKTLSRPDFNAISPNYYVNPGWAPFNYIASNPKLKPEHWTSYDAQFALHGNKIGLLSVTLFYKTVENKIWQRSYQRIKGDPMLVPFPDNALVNVTLWENNAYEAKLKGAEFEWQTNFSYLPKPFNYLTFSVNYTFTESKTNYPYTRIDLVTPVGGGRPVPVRVDSVTTGPLTNQPRHIANVSLGFNKKGFNTWLSYQYNGQIFTGKNFRGAPRLDSEKNYFSRWDLQVTQKFAIRKIKGFQAVANIANMSDFVETQKLSGDPRLTSAEKYGWTADLGLRYMF